MAVVGIGHALLFGKDATTSNPFAHVMRIARCRKNDLGRLVERYAGHVPYGTQCFTSLSCKEIK